MREPTDLRANTAVGSRYFEALQTRTTEGRYQEKILARCTGKGCYQVIARVAPLIYPLERAYKWLKAEGWTYDPILCPHCAAQRKMKKGLSTLGDYLPKLSPPAASAVAINFGQPPVQVSTVSEIMSEVTESPHKNGSIVEQERFKVELAITISGTNGQRLLTYIFRCHRTVLEWLPETHHYCQSFNCDSSGILTIEFGPIGSKISEQTNAITFRPLTNHQLFPPNHRQFSVKVWATFHDNKLTTDAPLPSIVRPISVEAAAAAQAEDRQDPPLKRRPGRYSDIRNESPPSPEALDRRNFVDPKEQPSVLQAQEQPMARRTISPTATARVFAGTGEQPDLAPPKVTPAPQPTRSNLPATQVRDEATLRLYERIKNPDLSFTDDDVRAMMLLIRECMQKRPDIEWSVHDGRVMARKLKIVEEIEF